MPWLSLFKTLFVFSSSSSAGLKREAEDILAEEDGGVGHVGYVGEGGGGGYCELTLLRLLVG